MCHNRGEGPLIMIGVSSKMAPCENFMYATLFKDRNFEGQIQGTAVFFWGFLMIQTFAAVTLFMKGEMAVLDLAKISICLHKKVNR